LKDLELHIFKILAIRKAIEEADSAAAENEDASSDEEDNEELHIWHAEGRRHSWKTRINAL
jgi:hypothetical protein